MPLQPSPFQPPCLEIQTTASANSTANITSVMIPRSVIFIPRFLLYGFLPQVYTICTDAEDVSHETLTAICNAVKIPVIAIGGITRDNVTELSGSGICGIAVISAIFAQKDIVSATKDLKEQTLRMLENK